MEKTAILFFAFLGAAFGQVINVGQCPNVTVVKSFDAAGYLGTWYEWGRYIAIFELATKCNSATYTLNSNGSVDVLNKAVNEISGETQEISGYATLVGDGTEGQLDVIFPSQNNAEANYYILGTNYKDWAAVFSCKDLGLNLSAKFAWLLTRERNPSNATVQSAQDAFAAQGVDVHAIIKVKQDDCAA